MSTDVVHRQRTEYVVFGFIRKTYPQDVPTGILDLIVLFYDLIYHWCFEKEKLKQIFKFTKLYVHDGITFKATVSSTTMPRRVKYTLDIARTPQEIDSIQIYAEFTCSQINDKYTHTFASKDDTSTTHHLWLPNDYEFEQLCFDLYLDTAYIIYKSYVGKENTIKTIHIPKNIKYKWSIETEQFETCNGVLSDTFNEFWSLLLLRRDNKSSLFLCARMLLVPYGIKSVCAYVTVKNNINDNSKRIAQKFEITTYQAGAIGIAKDVIDNVDKIELDIEIKVVGFIDDNDAQIPWRKRQQYGIM